MSKNQKWSYKLDLIFDEYHHGIKRIAGIITHTTSILSVISVICGPVLLWYFFYKYNLLYLISDISFISLMTRLWVGFITLTVILLLSFIVIPSMLTKTTLNLIKDTHVKLNDYNKINLKLTLLWFFVFLLPSIITFIFLNCINIDAISFKLSLCLLCCICLFVIMYAFFLKKTYERIYNFKSDKSVNFIADVVLSLLFSFFLISTFMTLIASSSIQNKWVAFFVCIISYFAITSFIISYISTHGNKSFIKVLKSISKIATCFIVFFFCVNPSGFFKATLRIIGITDMHKENYSYQYRFKTDDIIDELQFFDAKNYTQLNGNTYITGTVLFRYQSFLILCPSNFDWSTHTAIECADMSNIEYRRYIKKNAH